MTNPITPPPELVEQWCHEDGDEIKTSPRWYQSVCAKAARWGADQQLTEDAKWLDYNALNELHLRITPIVKSLQKAMHPQPPSLKEQALDELAAAERLYPADWSTIRQALEALDD